MSTPTIHVGPVGRVGRCIYCNSTVPPLTREHIVPQGMRGRSYLEEASCEPCRLITSAFEEEFQRFNIWPLRQALGLRGKRKPPATIPIWRLNPDGTQSRDRLPHHKIWNKGALPDFHRPPGFLDNRERDDPPPGADIILFYDPKIVGGKHDPGGHADCNPTIVARLLAKMAHAEAVRVFGIDGFEPTLPGVILGTDPHWAYWIGRPIQDDVESRPGTSTHIRLYHDPKKNGGIVLGRIQLLAELGGPFYDIVIGVPRAAPSATHSGGR